MSNWYDITPEQQKKIDKKNDWLNKLEKNIQLKTNELKKIKSNERNN